MKERIPYVRHVYYYETDKMGIVHHANYIRWFEEARLDYMRKNGADYAAMEAQGILMPVIDVSAAYKMSAKFEDIVEVYTSLTSFNGVRAVFEYEIYSEGRDHLLTTGRSGHCFVDEKKRNPLNLKMRMPETYEMMTQLLEGDRL